MEDDFTRAVRDGLRLAKRIYGGKDMLPMALLRPAVGMERPVTSLLPTVPMVYAIIGDPTIVDNPDIPSYQPHVHGRCDCQALIPLDDGRHGRGRLPRQHRLRRRRRQKSEQT